MNFQGISESFLKKINVNHQFTIISYNVIIGDFFYEGGYFMFQILVVEDDASLRKLMLPLTLTGELCSSVTVLPITAAQAKSQYQPV